MNPLSLKDYHRLNAAKGWLDLGNQAEANREIDMITPEVRVHPDVLEVRWRIHAHNKMWTAAFEIAIAICELDPDRPFGWIHRAYALNELDRTQKACDVLQEAVEKFPTLPVIPYSLACYTCRLQRPKEAWQWLEKAMARGDSRMITRLALEEPDLKPLWSRLGIKLANRRAAFQSAPKQRGGIRSGIPGQARPKFVRETPGRRFRPAS